MQEIFDVVNVWLVGVTLIGLFIGVFQYGKLPMVGSWFRWKTAAWLVILVGMDFYLAYYELKGDRLWQSGRLVVLRLVVVWEIWYCMHLQYILTSKGETLRGIIRKKVKVWRSRVG